MDSKAYQAELYLKGCNQWVTVQHIAKYVGASPQYIARAFRANPRVAIQQFVVIHRGREFPTNYAIWTGQELS